VSCRWPIRPKAAQGLKCHIFNSLVEHVSQTEVAQQSVTKSISVTIVNLVTPKAGAKHELLLKEPASGWFVEHLSSTTKYGQIHSNYCCTLGHTKMSCLALALGVPKFTKVRYMIFVTPLCYLSVT
jgi:hypothetical protein